MKDGALEERVRAKLSSRQDRNILRRLSPPSSLVDFSSNDYLSLSRSPDLRRRFLEALSSSDQILGSGGSRLLDGNSPHHTELEARLTSFFRAPSAILFNSGYDANVGFFSSVPQKGDAIVYDSLIHASVHDGMRESRVTPSMRLPFRHNSVDSLRENLIMLREKHPLIREGRSCVFVAIESLYSMDGDIAPLDQYVALIESLLPRNCGHIIVDEAHATGIYGPNGRGIVSMLGLENKILVRLHTFGKALATSGAVILTTPWIREYLVNYARPLIYTTAMANYSVIAMGCSLDILEEGAVAQLSSHLLSLSSDFSIRLGRRLLSAGSTVVTIPQLSAPKVASKSAVLPSPIIPILTRNPRSLAQHLQKRHGFLARPITHPTVPEGEERVRVCIHAGNTHKQVDELIEAIVSWAESEVGSRNVKGVQDVSYKTRL